MSTLHIENGQVFSNGKETAVETLSFNNKLKEVFRYIRENNIVFDFEKRENNITFSEIRPDIKTRLINAIMAERLVRPHGATAT